MKTKKWILAVVCLALLAVCCYSAVSVISNSGNAVISQQAINNPDAVTLNGTNWTDILSVSFTSQGTLVESGLAPVFSKITTGSGTVTLHVRVLEGSSVIFEYSENFAYTSVNRTKQVSIVFSYFTIDSGPFEYTVQAKTSSSGWRIDETKAFVREVVIE